VLEYIYMGQVMKFVTYIHGKMPFLVTLWIHCVNSIFRTLTKSTSELRWTPSLGSWRSPTVSLWSVIWDISWLCSLGLWNDGPA